MNRKKVCMLGAFSVGKTSLVSQFVKGIFSENYLTTVGVKIDKKIVEVDSSEIMLILWDLYGEGEEDEFQRIRMSYLQGSSGYILVVDGTRKNTLNTALNLHQMVVNTIGNLPFVVALNKADIEPEWDLDEDLVHELSTQGWKFHKTSAKTGSGVEGVFLSLAKQMT